IVRVDSQRSVYLPILKQGGDTNTISIVDGVRKVVGDLIDTPQSLVTQVVFDQSRFVKTAIETLLHEGAIGLVLTSLMILIFLGSMRATVAVLFSIPLSALATFFVLFMSKSTVNTMVLGGLALAFSRLIDNSVVVLENIYRHLEMGEPPAVAAEKGGSEVALPVLAATLTTAVVFFPVSFLYGVSKYLFGALAMAVIISLLISYFVAITVAPLFCSRYLKAHHTNGEGGKLSFGDLFNRWFNRGFEAFLRGYDALAKRTVQVPKTAMLALLALCGAVFVLVPYIGMAFFPQTDAGMFVINMKAPSGTRLAVTEGEVAKVEQLARSVIPKEEIDVIVSNIGITPDLAAIYSSNSGMHSAFVQVSLKPERSASSFEYMGRLRGKLAAEMPELSTFFQTGSLVDAVLNMGLAAPIDVQVSGSNLKRNYEVALELQSRIRALSGVSDVYVPQDIDYPSLRINIDRTRSGKVGLNQKEIVQNIITAVGSNQMIAPGYWIDPRSGIDYLLTVQYPETQVRNLDDFRAIPLRPPGQANGVRLDAVTEIQRTQGPTEVDHYQLQKVIDVYVRTAGEDLSRVANAVDDIIRETKLPAGVRVNLRGMVQGMRTSFKSFGIGLGMSVVLLYLILVAQFKSFVDPALILLAVPPAISGVVLTMVLTGTTLNVMSLMGLIMLVGIAVSNSILIVEFTHRLISDGMPAREAAPLACRIRLRPVLMTSLATIIGLLPMALKMGEGSEAFAPLARAIVGGLAVSVIVTVFLVPAAYVVIHGRREAH
ncbi:MAG: efflux RND transporter permease subunit, partial [Bryobacterales bacterium]|nr:efflux RND transporter permease subunit [Bryobacterales bacterium]